MSSHHSAAVNHRTQSSAAADAAVNDVKASQRAPASRRQRARNSELKSTLSGSLFHT